MPDVVPIFDEASGFIGVWVHKRDFSPTLDGLAELLHLAEPTFNALTELPYERTENNGVVRVGENISFEDGAFLMIDGHKATARRASGWAFISCHR